MRFTTSCVAWRHSGRRDASKAVPCTAISGRKAGAAKVISWPMRAKQAPTARSIRTRSSGSPIVAKLINTVMVGGKKTKAQTIVYGAFDIIEAKTKRPGIDVFNDALRTCRRSWRSAPKRVGGANYQIPIQVRAERRTQLAFRWLMTAAPCQARQADA